VPILKYTIIEYPLTDISAIKSLNTTLYASGVLVSEKTTGRLYQLDKTSILIADDYKVLQPTAGIGRWLLKNLINADGTIKLPDNLNANLKLINNLADPENDQDAATRKWVEDNLPPPITIADLSTSTVGLVIGGGEDAVFGSGTTIDVDEDYTIPSTVQLGYLPTSTEKTDLTCTDNTLTTATIGGLPAGSSIDDMTPLAILKTMVYEYLNPAFTSFVIASQATGVEVGVTISGAHTFTWGTSNNGNVQANSIGILDVTGSQQLRTGLANNGSENYNFTTEYGNVQLTNAGTYTWRISGINTHSVTFTRNFSVQWMWKKYWGTNAATSLTSSDVLALANNALGTGAAGTYAFVAGDYKYFCIPSSWSQPTNFKDHDTGFAIDMQSPATLSVTNSQGIATNYKIYRTTYVLTDAINIDVIV